MKTLIVEDDFTSRLILQEILRPFGVQHVAVSGEEAVRAFRLAQETGQPYDLICLDILMPGMDGLEALKIIRSEERAHGVFSSDGVKIIMITDVSALRTKISSFYELCDDYLDKPIAKSSLIGLIRSYGLIQ